jgi:hypothetical protein
VQPFPIVRDALVVLFWLWVLVAVGVYGFRFFRRVTQGPKAVRAEKAAAAGEARGTATAAEPPSGGILSGLGRSTPPPLPDGPIEARLPKSLQDRPAPDATGATAGLAADPTATEPVGDDASAPPPIPRMPTLAEALEGIRMPDDLLPSIDPSDLATADGRMARFSGTGTNVPTVAAEVGDELKRLGYAVDGLDTVTSARAGLSAHRDGTTVTAAVGLDDETGAVVVTLSL